MSKAQFEKALIPDLLSDNLMTKRTAIYLYKKYLSESELKDFLKASGEDILALSDINRKTEATIPFILDSSKLSAIKTTSAETKTQEAFQEGSVSLIFDAPYDISNKEFVVNKANIVGKPNFNKNFQYKDKEVKIVNIQQQIGLLVTPTGVEGPILKGIRFKVLD